MHNAAGAADASGRQPFGRQRVFDQRVTDVVAGLMVAAMIGYFFFEIDRRQRKLKEMIDVLDERDILFTNRLEELVHNGVVRPYGVTG